MKHLRSLSSAKPREIPDACSAVRSVARLLLRLPRRPIKAELADLLISDPAELNRRLRGLVPDAHCSAESVKKNVSRFRHALALAGIDFPDGRGWWPLTAVWRDFLSGLGPEVEEALFHFASWCGVRGIAPNAVTQRTLELYKADLLATRPHGSVMQAIRRVKRTWSVAVASNPDLKLTSLSVPGVSVRRHLRSDISDALRGKMDDLVAQSDPVSSRLHQRRLYLARFVASEQRNLFGRYPDSADDFLNPEKAVRLLEEIATRTAKRNSEHAPFAYELARLLCVLGRTLYPGGSAQLDQLEALRLDYAPEDLSLSEKNRDFLRHFRDYRNVQKLTTLPARHYRELRAKPSLEKEEYTELTIAFALHLMMMAPLNPALISSARMGPNGNVREERTKEGRKVVFRWSRPVGASGGPLEYALEGESLELYDAYTSHVRARHPGACTDFLFPGRGGHKNTSWFSQQMAQFTARKDILGYRINASGLRLAMGFVQLALDQPNAREIAADYLGNATRASLDALADLVDRWRISGVFADWPTGDRQ